MPSGATLKTTAGNSERMDEFYSWIAFIKGIPKDCFRLFISGDDVMIAVNQDYA